MRMLRAQLEALAASRATVLLTGETGTGKGLVAAMIHERSQAANGPLLHVDCASLAPSVIESELFGHERGAFTGALVRRLGRFERAAGGTLFLDEIAEIEPYLQAKLLRVLQDRRFERVGGTRTLQLEARVIAATNRDLEREIAEQRFRADLYYRLQVFQLRLPPLRDRISDLPELLAATLSDSQHSLGLGPEVLPQRITPAFEARLATHTWPGNVRELRNLVERLLIARPGSIWDAADLRGVLDPPGRRMPLRARPDSGSEEAGERIQTRAVFDERIRQELSVALVEHEWNISATARSLGVSRGALRARMARLGLR